MRLCIWSGGRQRHFDTKALPKDLNCMFHSSLLCQGKEFWFPSHNVWTALEEEQGFFPPLSVQSGSQAHTDQYRQRETSAYRPVMHRLRRIITHSHCPLPQLSCLKVKAKVINNTTLFLIKQPHEGLHDRCNCWFLF